MEKIRINSSVRRIEVNDNGEYIELNMGDRSFPTRYYQMVMRVNKIIGEVNAEAVELDAKYETHLDNDEYKLAIHEFDQRTHERILSEVDELFGTGTCKKVFGDIIPDISLYIEFFDQLQPFFRQYAAARAEKMNKYSALRTGNV